MPTTAADDTRWGCIRMLTIENQGFRRQLEQAAGLADLNDRRTR
jgi:hypothetical protein